MKINLKWHYETKHRDLEDFETFPQKSKLRTTKINTLKMSYEAVSRILVTSMTQHQKTTECSLSGLDLGKHKKPFLDAKIVKKKKKMLLEFVFFGLF